MSVLKKLIPIDDLKATIRRFPLSALCSVVLLVLSILSIHDVIDIDEVDSAFSRLIILCVAGFFWFGFARLVSVGLSWARAKEYALALGGFGALAALIFLGSGFTLIWMLLLFVPAVLLGISVAPHVRESDNLSFWFYNRQTWQGAAIAFLAALVWWGGLAAALAAIDYLFGVDVPDELYGDIWAFSATVFAPLYALSWVPEKFTGYSENDCHAPAQLAFLLNWVLAPLVVIYMLILYAYFIKIAIVGELPRGQLSYMVTAFGGVGVVTYLAGWPLRESGGALLRLVHRWFFPALIVPVIMQAISIYMRLDQYGVTEQRYVVALSVLWFGGLAIAYSFKKPPLKYITASLAILLLAAAIGPFSAPNLAFNSQMDRLEELLVQYDILDEGEIQETDAEISLEDRRNISSILSFLHSREAEDVLRDWLPDLAEDENVPSAYDLTKQMGFDYVSHYLRHADDGHFSFYNRHSSDVTNVKGYDYILRGGYFYAKNDKPKIWMIAGVGEVSSAFDDGVLKVVLPRGRSVDFNMHEFARGQIKKSGHNGERDMVLNKSVGGVRVRLIVNSLGGEIGEEVPVVDNVSYQVYVGGL